MGSVMLPESVDISKVRIDALKKKKGATGGGSCRITYEDGNPLTIQLPMMKAPFGKSQQESKATTGEIYQKYSVGVQVDKLKESDVKFRVVMDEMDTRIINFLAEHSVEIFGKATPPDAVREYKYNAQVKTDKEGKYAPTFKAKLPVYKDMPQFKVFSPDEKEVNIVSYGEDGKTPTINWDWLEKGTMIEMIIECDSLWVVNGLVYCTWKVVACIAHNTKASITASSFIRAKSATPAAVADATSAPVAEVADDEEYEDEE